MQIRRGVFLCLLAGWFGTAAANEVITVEPVDLPIWKPVYGRIEARDSIPARARIGGTLQELTVTEGDSVNAGQVIARITDDKLDFQLKAAQSQLNSVKSQLSNAETDLERGEALLKRGVTTNQRQDALRTQVDVLKGQIAAQEAQIKVIEQQMAEGAVLAPLAGRVVSVPQAAGAVIMPGEPVANIGGGGFYLRLAIPERHASALQQGAEITVTTGAGEQTGTLARIYPQIENGRVVADVEVPDLSSTFVDARVLVRVPVGSTTALMVPATALENISGIDRVVLDSADGPVARIVLPGAHLMRDGIEMVEIVTGLRAGDQVFATPPALPQPAAQTGAGHE